MVVKYPCRAYDVKKAKVCLELEVFEYLIGTNELKIEIMIANVSLDIDCKLFTLAQGFVQCLQSGPIAEKCCNFYLVNCKCSPQCQS